MNKQIILEQCDKIKNVVTEATQNEEEARSNAEKFKGIKEENTKLLDLLNKTKDIYWEMERILRIIEIDKEYDNTDNELENLKINVKDLIDKLRDNTSELEKYDSVKETVEFYTDALKDATDFISENATTVEETEVKAKDEEKEVPFSFDDSNDFNFDFDNDIFGNGEEETPAAVEEPVKEDTTAQKEEENDDNSLDASFDFSSMYGFDDNNLEDTHDDRQKVVDVTELPADEEEKNVAAEDKEDVHEADTSLEDNSLNELNDLFHYLNNDDSFNN